MLPESSKGTSLYIPSLVSKYIATALHGGSEILNQIGVQARADNPR